MLNPVVTRLALLLFLSFSFPFLHAQQVTLYDANFSGNGSRSGGASGQVGGSWSATPRSGSCQGDAAEFFGTRNGSFEITNFEGSGCSNSSGGNNDSEWRSSPINVRNYSNVNVTVELSGTAGGSGFEGNPNQCVPRGSRDCIDQIRVLVSIDGESFSSPVYRPSGGSFSATFSDAQGLCGNVVLIRILGGTQASDESFFIDRVLVTGERGGKPTAQNPSIERCVGQDAVLRITNVSSNAQIEWLDNEGDEISSANNQSTLTLRDLEEDDTGIYGAIVFDPDAGCFTPIFLEYEVFVLPGLPQAASLSFSSSTACEGEEVELIASPSGDGFEYIWAGPDGEEIERCRNSNICPIENVSLADSGPYLVILGNPEGGECALGEVQNTLTVLESPGQVTSIQTNFTFCEGERVEIQINTSNSGNYDYVWQSPDGTELSTNETNGNLLIEEIQANNQGIYRLFVSNLDGSCTAELNDGNGVNVLVNAAVEQPVIQSLGDACDALPSLQVEVEANQVVTWFNENEEQVAANTSTFLPTIVGNYYAVVSNPSTNCESPRSELFLAELGAGVAANITAEQEQICPRSTTTLTASGGNEFLWSTGETTPSITVSAGTYEVTITNEEGCTGMESIIIEAFPNFEAEIIGEAQVCEGEMSTLTASSGSQFLWNTNATSSSIEAGVGEYSVTITSENGCEKVANFVVEAFPDFEIAITGDAQVCEGETSTLTASGGSQYLWSTNATTPSIEVGVGEYSLTVTSANGCEKVANFVVEAFPDFEVAITGESQVCEGEMSTLTASGGSQYLWSTNATSPSIEASVGEYSVTITSENGCEKVANFAVEAFSDFEVAITGDAQVCEGETSTLTARGGSQYLWSTNVTAPSIEASVGEYSVTITSVNGCEKVANFAIEAFSDFEVAITGEAQVCEGETSTLTASGGSQYLWNTNATSPSIEASVGEYSVTITNENGCEKVANFVVEAFPDFEVEIGGENAVCEGEMTTLTATSGQSYAWSNGASTQNTEVGIGTYSVTVTNENGCEATKEITVTQYENPTLSISNSVTCAADLKTYDLEITTEAGNEVSVSTGTLIEETEGIFRIIEVSVTERLNITVTNEFGCSISETIIAPECPCPTIALPTSNGDFMICEGETVPTLSVNAIGENIEINWYDAPNDGNLLLENSNEFIPEIAGTYYAEAVSIESGCTSETRIAVTLVINPLPQIEVSELTSIDCNNNSGSILVEGREGAAPYEFAIQEGVFQTSNRFEELAGGIYDLFVKDANGCVNQASANIEENIRIDLEERTQFTCTVTQIGTDTTFFINELGCDSLIVTTTLDGRIAPTILTENTCNRSQITPDTLFLQNQFGCDSLLITNYNLVASDTTFLSGTTCDESAAGERVLNLVNQFGCDSVVVINTVFSDKDVLFMERLTCEPSQVGIDTAAFINQLGCDSLMITTTILQGNKDTTRLRVATCDFNSIGLDTTFFTNESGCDSLVITDFFFDLPNPPVIETMGSLTACQGDTVLLFTESYNSNLQWTKDNTEIEGATETQLLVAQSGSYTLSYTNEEGCVVVASNLIINFLDVPPSPVFSNENNLLSLENPELFTAFNLQWFLEDMPIEGANNPTLCISQSGNYRLVATDPNTDCSTAFSLFVEYDEDVENCTVNAEKIVDRIEVKVYPNPYRDHFTIESSSSKTIQLEIVNLLGQVFHQQQLSGQNSHIIDTENWTAGIYYLRFEAEGKVKVVKVVKVD